MVTPDQLHELLQDLRKEIMKESRRIFNAEFELLIDSYRLKYGEIDRTETVEYFMTLDGFD